MQKIIHCEGKIVINMTEERQNNDQFMRLNRLIKIKGRASFANEIKKAGV